MLNIFKILKLIYVYQINKNISYVKLKKGYWIQFNLKMAK